MIDLLATAYEGRSQFEIRQSELDPVVDMLGATTGKFPNINDPTRFGTETIRGEFWKAYEKMGDDCPLQIYFEWKGLPAETVNHSE